MRAGACPSIADVIVLGDDRLRVDALAMALERDGRRVEGRLVEDHRRRVDGDPDAAGATTSLLVLDVADEVDLDRLGIAADRVVVVHDDAACRWQPPTGAEVLDLSAAHEAGVAALLDDEGRLPTGPRGRRREGAGSVLDELTAREREVLEQLLTGDDGAVIGDRLGISEHTVRTHVQNLLPKLGVRSRAAAAVLALDLGVQQPAAGRAR